MIFFYKRSVWLLALLLAVTVQAQTPLSETRSALEKWVETRQLISKTSSDWQSDKEMLEQTVQLFQRELKAVEEQMGKLDTNNVQVEKERVLAAADLAAANESLEKTRAFAAEFEGRVSQLALQLPVPLQETIRPLLSRMPTNSASTKMAATERAQVLVGVLNELDKFNNAVVIFNEKQKNQKGEDVAVETVYVGLGAAYFVNEKGDLAGQGTSGANGWEWTINQKLAKPVREVIQIYRSDLPPKFVSLPVVIR